MRHPLVQNDIERAVFFCSTLESGERAFTASPPSKD
jgi:hypothetical protein